MSKFALGEEKLARQIFPANINLDIAALGSSGFFATNFSAIYPKTLSVFIPIDYVTNRMSNSIPAEFESFFHSLDSFLEYFERLTETKVQTSLYGKNVEYAVGKFSDFEYKGTRHSTFAISPSLPSGTITLLCRRLICYKELKKFDGSLLDREISKLDNETSLLMRVSEIRGTFSSSFVATADGPGDDSYIYWNMQPIQIFSNPDLAFAGLMLSTPPNYSH